MTNEQLRDWNESWRAAWQAFHDACARLHHLADRDGDLLKIDVKFQAGGKKTKEKQ